jgi:D-alanyl-D-alanine carboxypeptidase
MLVRFVTFALVAATLPVAAPAQATCVAPDVRTATAQRLRVLLDSLLAAHAEVPGISLHVEAPTRCLTWSGSAGVLDRTSTRTLSLDNPHRVASNTKTFVAVAVLRLQEEGKLGVDDPIARYLPATYRDLLRRDGYDPQLITIRHLLSHTSGIYDYAMDERYGLTIAAAPTHRWSREETVRKSVEWGAPYGAPGEVYHYSDTGYNLLGEIVERVSGRPYQSAVRQLVDYRKLGLTSTWMETLEPVPAGVPERAHQYQDDVDTYGWDASLDLWGGGGIAATMRDLAVFIRAVASGSVFRKRETLDLMLADPVPGTRDARGYRLGIARVELAGREAWGHSGYWNTFAYYIPSLDVAIAGSITQNQLRGARIPLASRVAQLVAEATR